MSNEIYSLGDISRKGRYVTTTKLKKLLSIYEPIAEQVVDVDGSTDLSFELPDGWNHLLKEIDFENIVAATMTLHGKKYRMVKGAIVDILGSVGFSERYVEKTPGPLLETHLNYWVKHGGVGRFGKISILTREDIVYGFSHPSYSVISNIFVIECVERYFKRRGILQDILVDPVMTNSFTNTNIKFVLANEHFEVEAVRNDKVEIDKWNYGFNLINSLVTSSPKSFGMFGYMANLETGAAILPELSHLSPYVRRANMTEDEVEGWVSSALDQILSVLPAEAEMIKLMPSHSLTGKVGAVATDIFRTMKVHRKVQERALEDLTVNGDLTTYGMLTALAKAANHPDTPVPDKIREHVMMVSGSLSYRSKEICDSCGRIHMFD